ncbi:MAG: YolD-like family protein [Bacilli bacterium]|nr:YolD-like family protein [Bacilli bacterium]
MNEDRGMMKWAPYQSLVEQASTLAFMRKKKNRVPKPSISSDQAAEINEILANYSGENVSATYWRDGVLYEAKGVISKIDAMFQFLLLSDVKIDFRNLIRLYRD